MPHSQTLLCLDIGSGTQDVLYFMPDRELENCPKFILPSPARIVGQQIDALRKKEKDVYLYGHNMGGGFTFAVRRHLQAGLRVAAHPEAALAIGDDLNRVRAMGIELIEDCPLGYSPVHLADFDPGFWRPFLGMAGLEYPEGVLACVQDHGFHPGQSNRISRFKFWDRFLEADQGRVEKLLFTSPPSMMTRLTSLKQCIGPGMVSDTGAAALLGALFDPEVEELSRQRGVCVVNVGNSHTVAFLVHDGRVRSIYEHHTGLLNGQKLWEHLTLFRQGNLANEDVFEDNGHGCSVGTMREVPGGFEPVVVLGPRRGMLEGFDVRFVSPGGDMMLAGAFGMLKGVGMTRCDCG
ncbi:MAG TPA: DUF1786 domain-containing protein [Desulfomicrobiaceae bacterium]|nr:DUF1786 domain-containing protein [Desulfomicrobiaceae bacterium]